MAEVEKDIASFCVQKLIPNAQYVFRIMALNSIGVSEPIESEPITIKVKIGKLVFLLKLFYTRNMSSAMFGDSCKIFCYLTICSNNN